VTELSFTEYAYDSPPEPSLTVVKDDTKVLVPRDNAEVFMLNFVAIHFGDAELRAKTYKLLVDVVSSQVEPNSVQFIEDEANLLLWGLWRVIDGMSKTDWRWAQARHMLETITMTGMVN
jgi:hypothetical protein